VYIACISRAYRLYIVTCRVDIAILSPFKSLTHWVLACAYGESICAFRLFF